MMIAAGVSLGIAVAWLALVLIWPDDDAQKGMGYVFITGVALVLLLLVWTVAGLLGTRRSGQP
jgi:hypothetical protein